MQQVKEREKHLYHYLIQETVITQRKPLRTKTRKWVHKLGVTNGDVEKKRMEKFWEDKGYEVELFHIPDSKAPKPQEKEVYIEPSSAKKRTSKKTETNTDNE